MYATRIPALLNSGITPRPEMTLAELNAHIPRSTQWKADNYNHLMEQPTQFYATVLALVAMGARDKLTVRLAWAYVGVRVVHSVVQATRNPIMVRFRIFVVSSLVLGGLTVRAGQYLMA